MGINTRGVALLLHFLVPMFIERQLNFLFSGFHLFYLYAKFIGPQIEFLAFCFVDEFSLLSLLFYVHFLLFLFSSICFLWVQKPEEGSISHRVQRLAKYRFLKVCCKSSGLVCRLLVCTA